MRDRLAEIYHNIEIEYLDYLTNIVERAIDGDIEDKIQQRQQFYVDKLLAHGVIVPPCKVGDTVYYLRYEYGGKMIPIPCTVDSIVYDGRWLKVYGIEERQNTQMWRADDFGKTVFLTREEAEQALKGGIEE